MLQHVKHGVTTPHQIQTHVVRYMAATSELLFGEHRTIGWLDDRFTTSNGLG